MAVKFEDDLVAMISADLTDFNMWLKDAEQKARDTGKRLDKDTLFKLKIEKAEFQMKLDEARRDLAEAKKDGDRNAILRLQVKADMFKSELTEAGRRLQNFQNTGDVAVSRLQAKFNTLNGTLWNVKWWIINLWGVIASYLSVRKVVELSEAFTNLQNRLKQVSDSPEQLATLTNKIYEAAQSSRVWVEQYATAFARFDMINKQLWGSQEETFIMLDSLSKWLSATGASATEVGSVMLQLSQAFGSWVLQWDEFRSVSENMPILLDILAKQLWVTRWEVKALWSDGKITSKVLKDALLVANEELNASFEKSSITIGQAMTQATNKFILKFWELDKTYWITETITKWISALSGAFIWLTEKVALWSDLFQYTLVKIANSVNVWVIKMKGWFNVIWAIVSSTLEFIAKNLWILAENIGIAFWNIPDLARKWLNLFLQQIQDTVNKAIQILNKIPKVNIEPVKLTLWASWTGATSFKAFEKYNTDAIKAITAETNRQIWIQNDAMKSSIERIVSIKDSPYWDLRGATDSGGNWPIGWGKWGGWSGWSKSKVDAEIKALEELEKAKEEEYKADFERQLKREKWIEKQEEEKQKKLKETAKVAEDIFEAQNDKFENAIKEREKLVDDFSDKIKDLNEDILKIDEDLWKLWQDRATTLWERNLEIEKEIAKLREDGWDNILAINKLLEEQKLIKGNATTDELNEAKRISELSPTAKFLEEFEAKKKALEEEKVLKQQQVADLEKQKQGELFAIESFTAQKMALEEKYKTEVAKIEEQITEKKQGELDKRLKAEEDFWKQSLSKAEAMKTAWLNTSQLITASTPPNNITNTSTGEFTFHISGGDPKAIADAVYNRILRETEDGKRGFYV